MNIRQIKYFVAVVNDGSFSAAAKEQYVTVQAVSKAIADLEAELGDFLFVRENRGVKLTRFGRQFLNRAEPALAAFAELEEFASQTDEQRNADRRRKARVALCSPVFHNMERACAFIALFLAKHLGLVATVEVMDGAHVLRSLRDGSVDVGITLGPVSEPGLDCTPLGTIRPVVMMGVGHPLASRDAVGLDDIAPYKVTLSDEFDYFSDAVSAAYADRVSSPQFQVAPRETAEFADFMGAENGLIMIPGVKALGTLFPETCCKPLLPEDAVAVPICIVSVAGRRSSAVMLLERLVSDDLAQLEIPDAGEAAPKR